MRTLSSALALAVLVLALCLGQTARAAGGGPVQAPTIGSGPSQISMPSISLTANVTPVGYELTGKDGLVWQTADHAVGWHRSSAVPGSPGNTVMSGHNASVNGGVFSNLNKVKLGDRITVIVNGRAYDYIVTDRVVFLYRFTSATRRAENARWLGQFGDERLTLVTCYPRFSNTHRLVVVAHPVSDADHTKTVQFRQTPDLLP